MAYRMDNLNVHVNSKRHVIACYPVVRYVIFYKLQSAFLYVQFYQTKFEIPHLFYLHENSSNLKLLVVRTYLVLCKLRLHND